jgi:nucleotide-binding universal stress UspA family protein
MRIRRILVPTDFSDASLAAWRYAQDLARTFKARIHVLHVIAPPYLYEVWTADRMPRSVSEFLAHAKPAAGKQLSRMVQKTGALARRVTTEVTTGSTVEDILKTIKAHRIDVVVMGTHGRTLVGQLLLGRTAERVVGHSPVPVITVHGRKAASARPGRRRRTS